MNADNTSLRKYYADAEFIQHTREEERELIIKAQAGDTAARDAVVTNNLRFVMKRAGKYIGLGLPEEDLIQEGNFGLFHAIKKFDVSRNLRFNTYAAWWIDQYIRRALMNQRSTVRVPVHAQREKSEDRSPDDTRLTGHGCSMEEALENGKIFDSIEDTCLDDIQREEVKQILLNLIEKQDEKHRQTLLLRYGLNGGEEMTLDDVGRKVGYCRERVRQVCDEFAERVRPYLERCGLTREFL